MLIVSMAMTMIVQLHNRIVHAKERTLNGEIKIIYIFINN